jgi:hypothetical protein
MCPSELSLLLCCSLFLLFCRLIRTSSALSAFDGRIVAYHGVNGDGKGQTDECLLQLIIRYMSLKQYDDIKPLLIPHEI